MKSNFWKFFGAYLVALPVGFYTAFVAMCFWNWFAVSALHVSEISFLQMVGLWWLIGLLMGQSSDGDSERWNWLISVIELCIPEDKKQAVVELTEGDLSFKLVKMVVGQMARNTFMLALGYVLHVFVL